MTLLLAEDLDLEMIILLAEDDAPECNSTAMHKCSHRAKWRCLGDPTGFCEVTERLWCHGRYTLWQRQVRDGTLCHWCERPCEHWTVQPLDN